MGKPRKKYKPRGVNAGIIQATLYGACNILHTDAETVELMSPYYAAMLRLKTGTLFDRADFDLLNVIVRFGFELGKLIHDKGDDDTKRAIVPTLPILEAASDALVSIGERYRDKAKFGATGDELQRLTDLASCVESILNVSTRGLVVAALTTAKNAVDQIIRSTQVKK